MQVIARDLQKHEIPLVIEFGHLYNRETSMNAMSYNPETTTRNLEKIILDRVNFIAQLGIVQHDDGREERIGLFVAQRCTPFYSDQYFARDIILVVRPEMRKRYPQCALLLLKNYRRWAIDGGCKLAMLSTISGIEMDRTAEFFERLGFKKLGTFHSLEL